VSKTPVSQLGGDLHCHNPIGPQNLTPTFAMALHVMLPCSALVLLPEHACIEYFPIKYLASQGP